jgi:hypothetical protein
MTVSLSTVTPTSSAAILSWLLVQVSEILLDRCMRNMEVGNSNPFSTITLPAALD